MDFEFSDDQVALKDAAVELLDGVASSAAVRAVFDAGTAPDRAMWSALVDQGWLGVDVPESAGGLGMGPVEVAILLEAVGRHAAPVPFASTVLAIDALRAGGDTRAEALLAGDEFGCVAWWGRTNVVRAAHVGGEWVLTGRPDPVPWAPVASVAIVSAQTDADVALFAVDLDALGRPDPQPAMDRSRTIGWLELDATPAVRLGGADAVSRCIVDRGATLASAELLGGADAALTMAVEYAKERVQFGKPIGSFQAVKHRCADMLVDVEGMRSTVYWAAWTLEADDADAALASSTAKTWCSDASKRVMASALQVHGGIGFTWEHDLHFYLKRAQLDQGRFGDAVFHRQRIARLLRPRVVDGTGVI